MVECFLWELISISLFCVQKFLNCVHPTLYFESLFCFTLVFGLFRNLHEGWWIILESLQKFNKQFWLRFIEIIKAFLNIFLINNQQKLLKLTEKLHNSKSNTFYKHRLVAEWAKLMSIYNALFNFLPIVVSNRNILSTIGAATFCIMFPLFLPWMIISISFMDIWNSNTLRRVNIYNFFNFSEYHSYIISFFISSYPLFI